MSSSSGNRYSDSKNIFYNTGPGLAVELSSATVTQHSMQNPSIQQLFFPMLHRLFLVRVLSSYYISTQPAYVCSTLIWEYVAPNFTAFFPKSCPRSGLPIPVSLFFLLSFVQGRFRSASYYGAVFNVTFALCGNDFDAAQRHVTGTILTSIETLLIPRRDQSINP